MYAVDASPVRDRRHVRHLPGDRNRCPGFTCSSAPGRLHPFEILKAEVGKEITSGKLTRAQAHRKWNDLVFGVPERARESLSKEQRRKLERLLGQPYAFNRLPR